jgi:hypothetical protein
MRKVVAVSSPTEVSWSGKYGGITAAHIYGDCLCHSWAPASTSSSLSWDSSLEAQALQAAYADYTTPQLDVGMMLAEGASTLKLLGSPFKSLAKLGAQFCKGIPKKSGGRQKLIDFVSDKWLEYRYGVLPLLSDIDGIRSQFHAKVTTRPPFFRTQGHAKTEYSSTTMLAGYQTVGYFRFYRLKTLYHKQQANAVCYWRSRYNDRNGFGAGIYDIPNLVWELVPYSFVFDWFVDVGGWLRTIQPRPTTEYLGNSVSQKCIDETIINLDHAEISLTGKVGITVQSEGSYSEKRTALMRQTNREIPTGPLVSPLFDVENIQHVLDGVALGYGAAKRSWPKPPRGLPRKVIPATITRGLNKIL